MAEPRKPSLILPVAGAALLLLAAYIGGYYWCIVPPIRMRHGGSETALYRMVGGGTFGEQYERHARWNMLFAPVHWLDRRIRSEMWDRGRMIELVDELGDTR